MQRPVFLKFGTIWINLALVTHVEFDETTKTANVFFGQNSMTKSREAYVFFKKEDPAWLFTKLC